MSLFDARRLAATRGVEIALVGYRNQASGFDPRSGEGARRAGGRYNPPHSFPVLYLCTTRPCVVAELTRQARRQGIDVADLLPRELWTVTSSLTNVLDLTNPAVLTALELEPTTLAGDDMRVTREIGEAAYEHRFQAIRSASATGVDDVIAVFTECLSGAVLDATLVQEWRVPSDLQ